MAIWVLSLNDITFTNMTPRRLLPMLSLQSSYQNKHFACRFSRPFLAGICTNRSAFAFRFGFPSASNSLQFLKRYSLGYFNWHSSLALASSSLPTMIIVLRLYGIEHDTDRVFVSFCFVFSHCLSSCHCLFVSLICPTLTFSFRLLLRTVQCIA